MMEDKNIYENALASLEKMSHALDRVANKPEHKDTEYGRYLEIMSFEMVKHANEIRETKYLFEGITHVV